MLETDIFIGHSYISTLEQLGIIGKEKFAV